MPVAVRDIIITAVKGYFMPQFVSITVLFAIRTVHAENDSKKERTVHPCV
jgi:hypothetical protein